MKDKIQLSEVAEIIMGQSPDSTTCNSVGLGLPFLQGCGEFGKTHPKIENYCFQPRKISPKDSVLISVRAPVGDVNIANTDFAIGRGLAGIVAKNIDRRFLYYSIIQNKKQLKRVSQGSTFEAINTKNLHEFEITFFEPKQQRKIAKILSTCDTVIEKTEAAIAKYQAIKQGMMHDLFTRGIDLETGKLRPKYEEAPELYKESELGMIPREWEVKRLGELLCSKPNYGINAPAVEFNPNYPTYLRITDIDDEGNFIKTGRKSVDNPFSKNYVLNHGDLVFARTGATVGKTFLYDNKEGELVYAGFLIKVSPNSELLVPKFLKFFTDTNLYKNWVLVMSQRSGQPGINGNEYSQLLLPTPNFLEQKDIANKINSTTKKLQTEQTTLSKYRQIKSGLMQDLLSGEVEVQV